MAVDNQKLAQRLIDIAKLAAAYYASQAAKTAKASLPSIPTSNRTVRKR